jgi:hypothetical protein
VTERNLAILQPGKRNQIHKIFLTGRHGVPDWMEAGDGVRGSSAFAPGTSSFASVATADKPVRQGSLTIEGPLSLTSPENCFGTGG